VAVGEASHSFGLDQSRVHGIDADVAGHSPSRSSSNRRDSTPALAE
jgi:hypothetical protein